jgi:hypothetical protein
LIDTGFGVQDLPEPAGDLSLPRFAGWLGWLIMPRLAAVVAGF